MWPKPHARGWCHPTNYWAAAQILLSDIDGSHAIAVPGEATLLVRTAEHPSLHTALAHMPAHGTGTRGVPLLLQGNLHAQPLGLVGEQVAHMPMRPLVDLLVVRGADIVVLPDRAHIANDQRLHAFSVQRGNEPRGLFVLDLLDLVFELAELPLLGLDQALAPL